MSQIFKPFTSGSPIPPTIPTQFTGNTGTATPSGNNINILGDDTSAYDADGISTSASGDTVTVLLNNRVQGTGTTVGATTADIITFAMGATPGTYKFDVQISGFNSSTPSGAGFGIEVCAITTGAAATVIDTDVTRQRQAATNATDFTAVASGNNLIFRVTGQAALTINWSASGTYERAI